MDSFVQKSIKIIELLQKAAKDDTSEVASIAVCDGDSILMGKRRDSGRYTLPGGHLDKGEEKQEGAVRELFEESGIKVGPNDLKYLGSESVTTNSGKKKLIHAFKYNHDGERPTTKNDPDKEVEKWEWIDCSNGIPKEICENAHTPVDKNICFKNLGLKPEKELDKAEPLFKPYRSEAQRRWAHTAAGKKALGGEAGVSEWDSATKGKHLPEKVKKEDLRKSPVAYNYDDQEYNIPNPTDDKHVKQLKEVKLPNGLLYRQYASHSPKSIAEDDMDKRSGRRIHALFSPDHPTPLAILSTANEEDPMAPNGFHPHAAHDSSVDKDFRGKGLGKQLYLATLVHGTKKLTSDSYVSPSASNVYSHALSMPGIGGKMGRNGEVDRHQLHIKDPKALDQNKMFPKVDIFDKLASSEKKVDLKEIKRLLESPEEIESMDIPEHLQIQWSTPSHRWTS